MKFLVAVALLVAAQCSNANIVTLTATGRFASVQDATFSDNWNLVLKYKADQDHETEGEAEFFVLDSANFTSATERNGTSFFMFNSQPFATYEPDSGQFSGLVEVWGDDCKCAIDLTWSLDTDGLPVASSKITSGYVYKNSDIETVYFIDSVTVASDVTAVPEPGTAALMMAALAAMVTRCASWRRKAGAPTVHR